MDEAVRRRLNGQWQGAGRSMAAISRPWSNGNVTEDEPFCSDIDEDGGSWHYDGTLYRHDMERPPTSPSPSMQSANRTRSDREGTISEHHDEGRKSQSFSILEERNALHFDVGGPPRTSTSRSPSSSYRDDGGGGGGGDGDGDGRGHGVGSQSVIDLFDPKQAVLLGAADVAEAEVAEAESGGDGDGDAAERGVDGGSPRNDEAKDAGKWRVELLRENGDEIEDGNGHRIEAAAECLAVEWAASSTPSQTPSYLKQEALWSRSLKLELSKNGTNSTGSSEDDDEWMLHNQINVGGLTHSEHSALSTTRRRTHFFADSESAEFPNVGTTASVESAAAFKMRVSPHSQCTQHIAAEHELHRALYLKQRDIEHAHSPLIGPLSH